MRHFIRQGIVCCLTMFTSSLVFAGPDSAFWLVDEVKPGMTGQGRTVVKGTKIESFNAEVIGVLRNTSPGRDLILCHLSGLDLEKTGVIQGMSGSPIYLGGKLLGAVAYAWPNGKVPIAGITPFVQMQQFALQQESKDVAAEKRPRRIGLATPLDLGGQRFETVTVSQDFQEPQPTAADGLFLMPLRTPLCATGFSRHSLDLLQGALRNTGLTPMQGGGVGKHLSDDEKNVRIEPGAALAVALVMGDFDMSGIGTVTHVEGKRVYGWGHPFMSSGGCELPLMTGYTHTIMPRHTISFKMGSPLRTVGVINADVSTCIAGWLDRPVDLLPVHTAVKRFDGPQRAFNVTVVRQKQLLPGLLAAVMTNSVDMEGDLPDEMTARIKVRFHLEDRAPIVMDDLHSGSMLTGSRGPQAMYSQVSLIAQLLSNNSLGKVRIEKIDAETEVMPGRRTAEIESVVAESDSYAPGEEVRARVVLRPYKGAREFVPVSVRLPADMPEGIYTALVGDGQNNARQILRDSPHLSYPTTLDNLVKAVNTVAAARRTQLVMRIPTQDVGVTLGDHALPDLPPSMVQILGSGRRTGTQPIAGAVVGTTATSWVLQGADSFRFTVARNRKISTDN